MRFSLNHIIKEDHYYPFGLSISALSSTAPLSKPNNFKYHGQELQEEFDLGWYQFKWRNHDPTIGRFFNLDPLSEQYVYNSPYAFGENKLGLGFELEGMEMELLNGPTLQMRMKMSPQDRKQLDKATLGMAKAAGGVIAIAASAGSAAPLVASGGTMTGAFSIVTGSIETIAGATNNFGSIEKMPSTPLGVLGVGIDGAMGNENRVVEKSLDLVNNAALTFTGVQNLNASAVSVADLIISGASTLESVGALKDAVSNNTSSISVSPIQLPTVGNISLPNINFNPVFQTINSGDNLTKIAQQNNTTVQSLVNLNNIENPDLIKAGASLRVK